LRPERSGSAGLPGNGRARLYFRGMVASMMLATPKRSVPAAQAQ